MWERVLDPLHRNDVDRRTASRLKVGGEGLAACIMSPPIAPRHWPEAICKPPTSRLLRCRGGSPGYFERILGGKERSVQRAPRVDRFHNHPGWTLQIWLLLSLSAVRVGGATMTSCATSFFGSTTQRQLRFRFSTSPSYSLITIFLITNLLNLVRGSGSSWASGHAGFALPRKERTTVTCITHRRPFRGKK